MTIFWYIDAQQAFTNHVNSLSLPEIRKGFVKAYHAFKAKVKEDGGAVSQESRELFMKASIYYQALPTTEQPIYRNIASESWMKENNLKPIIRNN